MKNLVFVTCLLLLGAKMTHAQLPESVAVSPMSSYEEVCGKGIINTLNHEYFPFTLGASGEKTIFIVHVDKEVVKGEEEAFLNSRGFTLVSDPINYFFGVVDVVEVEGRQMIACPLQGVSSTPIHYKERCDCSGKERAKITRSTGPSVWGGKPDGELFFLAEKIDPS